MKLVTRITFVCFLLAAAASVLLYNTSYKVQALKTTQRQLDADIVAEQNAIRVLQAEWAFLAEPSRIERLASHHLAMKKIESIKTGVRIQTARHFAAQPTTQNIAQAATKPAKTVSAATATKTTKVAAAPSTARATAPSSTPNNVQLLLASFKQQ